MRSPLTSFAERNCIRALAQQSDAEIGEFLRNELETLYHPVGTCKMGDGCAGGGGCAAAGAWN